MRQIEVYPQNLKRLFDGVKLAADKSGNKPALGFIQLKATGNTLTATALDGYRMHEITVQCENVGGDDWAVLVMPVTIPKSPIPCTITVDATMITYDFNGSATTQRIGEPDLEYVNTEKIKPTKEPTLKIAFDRRYLIDALKSCANNIVKFEFSGGAVSPVVLNSDGGEYMLVLPVLYR